MVPFGEDAEDGLARGHDGVDLGRPGLGIGRELIEFSAQLMLGPRPLGSEQRSVEAAVSDLAGQVADARVPQLGGRDQLVDHPQVAVAAIRDQYRVGQRGRAQGLRVAQPPS